jgi:hypothetical protein
MRLPCAPDQEPRDDCQYVSQNRGHRVIPLLFLDRAEESRRTLTVDYRAPVRDSMGATSGRIKSAKYRC